MAVEPAWAIQMKQVLAGLPLNEQEERLRPERPVQLRGQRTASETADSYSGAGCQSEEARITGSEVGNGKTTLKIRVRGCDEGPLVGDVVLVDDTHKFTLVSVQKRKREQVWICLAEAKGEIEYSSDDVVILGVDQEVDFEDEELETADTREGTDTGSGQEGSVEEKDEEATTQTEDSGQEGRQEEQEKIREKYEHRAEPWILDMFSFLNHVDSRDAEWIRTDGKTLHINEQEFWGDVCACILDTNKDERLKYLGQIKSCDPEDIPRELDNALRKSADPAWHMNYDIPEKCEEL